jgi:hypothetical protein
VAGCTICFSFEAQQKPERACITLLWFIFEVSSVFYVNSSAGERRVSSAVVQMP